MSEPGVPAPANGTLRTTPSPGHEDFRRVLRHLASGVVAVTGIGPDGAPAGLTVSSFVSVSLDPPLVSFCAARSSTTWPRLRAEGRVCVTILSERQAAAATQFAARVADRFPGVGWRPSPGGLPILDDGLAWLECTIEDEYPAGDHVIVLCRADRLAESAGGGPLLRFRGDYGRLAPGR